MSKRRLFTRLRLREVSTVDRGMNQHAEVLLWKRAPDIVEWLSKSYDQPKETFAAALADVLHMEAQHEVRNAMYPLFEALQESAMTIAANYSGEDRTDRLRKELESFMSMCREKLAELDASAGAPGNTSLTKEDSMSKELETKLGELQAQHEAFVAKHDELTQEHAEVTKRHNTLLESLSALDVLTVTKAEDGSVEIEVVKAADPEFVEIDGHRIEKGAPGFELLKMQSERISKMEEERTAESFLKRAAAELPNLSGSNETKGILLRAVEKLDETVREEVMKSLRAADEATKGTFTAVGKGAKGEGDAHDPEVQLENMAKALVAEGRAPDLVQARAAVLKSAEGRALRAQSTH